jgi:hypothetical protein
MTTNEAVQMLKAIAKRGFNSEPRTYWLNKDIKQCFCEFTEEEKRALRSYLGNNQILASLGKRTTISLLGRISYAMNGRDISPEYVAGLAEELRSHESTLILEGMMG